MNEAISFDTSGVAVGDEAIVNCSQINELLGGILFRINGQLTTYNSTQFQALINDAVAKGFKNFIFDCNSLNYCSSTGVGAFTFAVKALKDVNGNIVISGMQPKVKDVFQLLGFSTFFNFAANPTEAIQIFSGKSPVKHQAPVVEATDTLEVIFPIIVKCPSCSKKFRISKPGRYRCSGCQKLFTVAGNGETYN